MPTYNTIGIVGALIALNVAVGLLLGGVPGFAFADHAPGHGDQQPVNAPPDDVPPVGNAPPVETPPVVNAPPDDTPPVNAPPDDVPPGNAPSDDRPPGKT